MLHPVGPLPASVYWRRRALALVGVIAVLAVLGTTLTGDGGRQAAGAPPGGGRPAADAGTATGSSASPTPSGSPTTTTPPPLEQSGSGDGGPGLGSGADPGTETAVSPSPTPSPDPPGPCPDGALRLTVKTVAPVYPAGAMPVIALTVQNVSTVTCTRDVGAAQQEVLLYAGATRLWSSNDCYPGGLRDVQALLPRERATFSVTWSGLSSRPHCAGTRTRVGPGRYRLSGRLGTLRSAAATLTLR